MNDYYVYEWIRLDTNEPFYVGKGHGNRWRKLKRDRNSYFNNIVKSIPVAVNILHDNLDEEIAYGLEIYYIWLYRDVIGYKMCNMNDGGEGQTLCGENNPFYGKHHTEETKQKISEYRKGKYLSEETKQKVSENHAFKGKKRPKHSEKMKGKFIGENHPMYGKNPLDYMTEEAKIERSKKISENNAKYWKGKHFTEETKNKISEAKKGRNNPRARAVICLTTGKIFYTSKEGAEYYNIKNPGNVTKCLKGRQKSAGKLDNNTPLKWMYLDDFLSKCKYIEL